MSLRNDGRPIFLALADQIADDILADVYPEGSQVPSTNELAAHYRINPATAGKALNRLVDTDVLHKRRGLGMFVSDGALSTLRAERRAAFTDQYLKPLIQEARRLGISTEGIVDLLRKEQP